VEGFGYIDLSPTVAQHTALHVLIAGVAVWFPIAGSISNYLCCRPSRFRIVGAESAIRVTEDNALAGQALCVRVESAALGHMLGKHAMFLRMVDTRLPALSLRCLSPLMVFSSGQG